MTRRDSRRLASDVFLMVFNELSYVELTFKSSKHLQFCGTTCFFVSGRLRGAAVPAPDQTQWEHPHLTSTCLTSIGRRKGQQKREADPRNGTVPWSSVPFNFWSKIISLSFACQTIKNIDFFQTHVQEIPRLMVFPKRTNNVKVIWYNFLIFAHWLLQLMPTRVHAWVRVKGSSISSATWVISTLLKGSNILTAAGPLAQTCSYDTHFYDLVSFKLKKRTVYIIQHCCGTLS